MNLALLKRAADGKLSPLKDSFVPSLPCPQISVNVFEIRNLRENPEVDFEYVCDITVKGTVKSTVCDVIPGAEGCVDHVRFVHNDGKTRFPSFPVLIHKRTDEDLRRPFPFDGQFDFTVTGVSVTGGDNTFRILARDKVYGLDGFSLWGASFSLPFRKSTQAHQEAMVLEQPRLVGGGEGGELSLYCIQIEGVESADDLTLVIGGESPLNFDVIKLPGTDLAVATWPKTLAPAYFSVRPAAIPASGKPTDFADDIADSLSESELSERAQFHYGFGLGVYAKGADLVFAPSKTALNAGTPAEDHHGIAIQAGLHKNGTVVHQQTWIVPDETDSSSFAKGTPLHIPDILWHLANLFRAKDSKADEAINALLLGDLTAAGLRDISIADCRESFFLYMAEVLEELMKETADLPPGEQGYQIGHAIGDALRVCITQGKRDPQEELGKSEFLALLGEMPYFEPGSKGHPVLEKLADELEYLKEFPEGKSG